MRTAAPKAARIDWEFGEWAHAHVRSTLSPAVLVRGDGSLAAVNQYAKLLLDGDALPASVQALVIDTRMADRIQTIRSTISCHEGESGSRRFDLTFIPAPMGMVLIIGRDTTLEINLLNALAASRQLFRDLALCSSDFAFETDVSAYFSYVSPAGFVGYSAEELHGSRPQNAFDDTRVSSLFSCRTAIRDQEIWTQNKSGEESCIVVTAIPMLDSQGGWCGSRGVARDITLLRCHEREISRVRARVELVQAIVDAMRAQVDPRRMLLAACDALCAATGSDFASINVEATGHCASIGRDRGSQNRISIETNYHGVKNGAVLIARNDSNNLFQEADRSLLAGIVPHLGVANALVQMLAQGLLKKPMEYVA